MRKADIIEALVTAVEETIFKEWRHEGCIEGFGTEYANFDIDGTEYVLNLQEVKNGEHWSEKVVNGR